MRIQVYASSDGSTSSNGQRLDTKNILSIFPRGISLNRIHSDHIYSSLHTNQTTESGEECSESDGESLADITAELENEEPIKPQMITLCVRKQGTSQPEQSRDCSELEKIERHDGEARGEDCILKRSPEGQDPLNDCTKLETVVGFEGGHECEDYMPISTDKPSPGNISYDDENDMLSLNADSIQKVFQNTIYMTSFMPISEGTNKQDNNQSPQTSLGEDNNNTPDKESQIPSSKIISNNNNSEFQPFKIYDKCLDRKGQKCVKLKTECNGITDKNPTSIANSEKESNMLNIPMNTIEKECPNNPSAKLYKNDLGKQIDIGCRAGKRYTSEQLNTDQKTVHKKLHNNGGKTKPAGERGGSPKAMCQTVNDKEYREISKDMENDRELCVKINYTLDLLVRKWCEYLTMTADQIRDMEIQNAKDMNMVEEVIEMLEDNDRYVWELIDELKFF